MSQSHVSRLVRHLTIAAALTAVTAIPARAQSDIVLHAANATTVLGDWQQVADATAAAGRRMWNPDRGAGKQRSASANPYDYFELTFTAQAGRGYRLWIRGRAENDSWSRGSCLLRPPAICRARFGPDHTSCRYVLVAPCCHSPQCSQTFSRGA